jgi:hypothetical protein
MSPTDEPISRLISKKNYLLNCIIQYIKKFSFSNLLRYITFRSFSIFGELSANQSQINSVDN